MNQQTAPTGFTLDQLKPYFFQNRRHKCYKQTVDIAKRLRLHADGEKPGELLTKRRPGETDEVQKYRDTIWVEITEGSVNRIVTCLSKIRKSPDWSIRFDADTQPAGIQDEDTLEKYITEYFPYFESITNWMFQLCLKQYLVDPNAVCFVLPLDLRGELVPQGYLRPYPLIFPSENVYEFVEEEYAVLYSTDKSLIRIGENTEAIGDVYYYVDKTVVQRWEQTDQNKNMQMVYQYRHDLGRMPAFKLKGVVHKTYDRSVVYKSRISAVAARLDEAVREYSDLQGGVVTTLYPTPWYYGSQFCEKCEGVGEIASADGPIECPTCKGKKRIPHSPYTPVVVEPPQIGEQHAPPTPPGGFIEKDIEIIKLQDERVEKHIYHALSAINMQFLADAPLNQSGAAKEVDRDELNTFVNSVAEDVVKILDLAVGLVTDFRYAGSIVDSVVRKKMRPKIAVPERFDLLNSEYVLREFDTAKKAGVNPVALNALEVEYTNKKFNNDPIIRDLVKVVLELDPLSNISDDNKQSRVTNKGVTQIDYIISCNIYSFVRRAANEDKNFFTKKLADKRKLMEKYAKEVEASNSAGSQVMGTLDPANLDGAPVQDTALNGAQMAQLEKYTIDVAQGLIPIETGIALAKVSFPTVDVTLIESVFNPLKTFDPKKSEPLKDPSINNQ